MAQVNFQDKEQGQVNPIAATKQLTFTEVNQVKNAINRNDHWRGPWGSTTALPEAGGTYDGGVAAAGNEWRLTNTLTIGTNVFPPGTIIKATDNDPGQDLTKWVFLAFQTAEP